MRLFNLKSVRSPRFREAGINLKICAMSASRPWCMACSIAGAADIVGDKWTILLVRDLFIGISKFDDFHTSLDIPTTTLANRLKVLTDQGLVEKRPYQSSPTRFAYRLTQKGRDLWPVLLAIAHWGDKYNMSGCGPPPDGFRRPHIR